jgi:hypothetical protein
MSSGVRDFWSGAGIGVRSEVRAKENTHADPRRSARAYPAPMPRRAASSQRRSRDELLLLGGQRAAIMLSTTAVDHAWAAQHSRSSPRSRCSRMTRIYERGCARMSSKRPSWVSAKHRRCVESRAWGWAHARDWRRRIRGHGVQVGSRRKRRRIWPLRSRLELASSGMKHRRTDGAGRGT